MARPSDLTRDLQERIVSRIVAGNTAEDAIESLGLDGSTLYDWLKKGRSKVRGPQGSDTTYVEFAEAIKKARAECRVRLVIVLRDAAQGQLVKRHNQRNCPLLLGEANECDCPTERLAPNPFIAARMLESIDPQHWNRMVRVEMSGRDGGPIAVESPATRIERELAKIGERLLSQVIVDMPSNERNGHSNGKALGDGNGT